VFVADLPIVLAFPPAPAFELDLRIPLGSQHRRHSPARDAGIARGAPPARPELPR